MIDRIGQLLGNYRLTRLLGRGGYADVYLGEHIYLRTQAALKILQIQLTPESIEDFLTEARTLVQLEHPHIVRVLECGVEDHTPFLVMSYAPGGSLRQRCPRGARLNPRDLVSYVTQIASALQYAHERKLIHRDIKPENILLGSNDEILLSDFGLVLTAQSTGSQVTKEMVGTVPYMAPEQLQGKPRPASDQYALGIMVYEWLSGRRPFQGTFIEIASQHMLAPPSPLYGHIPGISSEVERVLFTALAKDPAQRFNSVQDFAFALQHAYRTMQSGPVTPSASGSVIDESSLPTFVQTPTNQPSQSASGATPSGQSILPTNLNTPPPTQPTYVIPPRDNQLSQPASGAIPSGQSILPTNLNTPPPTQPTYVHHPQTQSSQPTYVIPPWDNLSLPPSHPGAMQSDHMMPATPMQTTRVVPQRQRGIRWSLISLLSVMLLLLIILGSLVLVPGISKTLGFMGFSGALPTPSVANTGTLPTQVATATPTLTPTSVPTQAYANAPTATPIPTPTPTVAYAAFKVISIDISVNPTSIQGTTCGTSLTVTYTATFHVAANSPGGVVQFNYTINNGRGESTDSITFASGQTTKTYSFTWSGNLPADHTYPEPGGVISTSPNSVNSGTVGPTGQCS